MLSTLILISVSAFGAEAYSNGKIVVRGTVIGADGRPIANATIGTNWTPMGWYDDEGKRRSLGDPDPPRDASRWTQGAMQPTSSHHSTATNEKGEFECSVPPGFSLLLAFDERTGDRLVRLRRKR